MNPSSCRDYFQRGLSLVEVMLALTIGLVLVAGVTRVQITTSQIYQLQNAQSRLQENARFAIHLLTDSIQDAGYMGCTSSATFISALNFDPDPASQRYDYAYEDFVGYPVNANLSQLATIQGSEWTAGPDTATVPTNWTPVLDPSVTNPGPGSDVVTIRGPLGNGTRLIVDMVGNTDSLAVPADSGLSACDIVLVANCVNATLVQITQIGAEGQLLHDAANCGAGTPPGNSRPDLGVAYLSGDSVLPYGTISYYLGVVPGTENDTALYRQINSNAPEMLVEGVEQMQILYGEDTDPLPAPPERPDFTPNRYVTADFVSDWRRVVSVRISLLLRTVEDNLASTPQTYTFEGLTTTATDRRLRYGFTLTIGLRNRLS